MNMIGSPPENLIRDRAYMLWVGAGRPSGRDLWFWFEAKRLVQDEIRRAVSKSAPKRKPTWFGRRRKRQCILAAARSTLTSVRVWRDAVFLPIEIRKRYVVEFARTIHKLTVYRTEQQRQPNLFSLITMLALVAYLFPLVSIDAHKSEAKASARASGSSTCCGSLGARLAGQSCGSARGRELGRCGRRYRAV